MPAAIEAGLLPVLKGVLAQEAQQAPTRAVLGTIVSCVRLVTDKPFGARSVLADPELYHAVLDTASTIMTDWCSQHKHSTAQLVTARTSSDAMVTVANLLAAGERSALQYYACANAERNALRACSLILVIMYFVRLSLDS